MIEHGSITEVAKATGSPPTRIRRLVKIGAIPSAKIGSKYIIKTSNVLKWLEGSLPPPADVGAAESGIRRIAE